MSQTPASLNAAAEDAAELYHSLLINDAQLAADTQGALEQELQDRRLVFGDKMLSNVLRPKFFTPESWETFHQNATALWGVLRTAHEACMSDPALRAQLHLEAWEERLSQLPENGVAPWTTARPDFFYNGATGEMKALEFNATTPAGIGYVAQADQAFRALPAMQEFQEHYDIRSFPGMARLLTVLEFAYRQWGGRGEVPQIGIVDWQDVVTLREHEIIREYFQEHGYPTRQVDPRDLEYRADPITREKHLYTSDGFRVDIVYKRVLLDELIDRMGENNAIVQAIRDQAVLMTNSFASQLMYNKAAIAFISDEKNAHIFSAEEREVINRLIPWSRMVQAGRITEGPDGHPIDLLDFIALNKDRLVIKPSGLYGGKDVTIGMAATDEEWGQALQSALSIPYIVQERVSLVQERFPMMEQDGLHIVKHNLDTNPYVFSVGSTSVSSGALVRLSAADDLWLNVSRKGSVIPAYVVEEKGRGR